MVLRCMLLFFSRQLRLKHTLLRAFLKECLPEMLSKVGVLVGAVLNKSEKMSRESSAALRRSSHLREMVACFILPEQKQHANPTFFAVPSPAQVWPRPKPEPRFYIDKLPINRLAAVMLGGLGFVDFLRKSCNLSCQMTDKTAASSHPRQRSDNGAGQRCQTTLETTVLGMDF